MTPSCNDSMVKSNGLTRQGLLLTRDNLNLIIGKPTTLHDLTYSPTMFSPRFRRLSKRLSKKYGFLCFLIILLIFLWLKNWYSPGDDTTSGNTFSPQETHVFIPVVENPIPEENKGSPHTSIENQIAILVMSATRPEAIKNHLSQLIRLRPSTRKFPIVISQDGDTQSVTEAIRDYVNETAKISFIHHKDRVGASTTSQKSAKNYFYISQHYKWALDKVFNEMGFKTIIITEDDLDIADDFFSYFASTQHLLYEDASIWCISAFNDNGALSLADRKRSDLLYRTDFFPGLGWMLTSKTWGELSPKWPEAYWDDWLRRQDIRNDRVCVRPEISRTYHNMKVAGKGSSNGLYKTFLSSIRLPESPVDFSLVDVDRLKKEQYDSYFGQTIKEAKEINIGDLFDGTKLDPQIAYRVVYKNPRDFRRLAKQYKLMNDFRSGMARTAYYGVISFLIDGARTYAISGKLDMEKPFGSFSSREIYTDEWDKMNRYLDFADLYCKAGKWTGKCDPKDPGMIDWFKRRNQSKRLVAWGEMIVI